MTVNLSAEAGNHLNMCEGAQQDEIRKRFLSRPSRQASFVSEEALSLARGIPFWHHPR